MRMSNVLKTWKKAGTVMLSVALMITGIAVDAVESKAADETNQDANKVVFEEVSNVQEYWTESSKKAPVKSGYVFGGWYKGDEETPYKASEMSNVTEAKAKFVPASVLSVKAQNSAGITQTSILDISKERPMHVRVMTSLDSTNYQKVGFDIELGNRKKLLYNDGPLEQTTVYTGIKENDATKTATQIFGSPSQYLSVWKIGKIDTPSNADKIIYVRPYWVTMDGTTVYGMAKYVHIEDDYMDYVSVPVNLLDNVKVAAGQAEMSFASELKVVSVEAGRILPEMEAYTDSAKKKITMVGNAATVNQYHEGETLYANVRVKQPSATETFTMKWSTFCDWQENLVSLSNVWNVKYISSGTN